jgi:predicted RNase H-like HicB family nuclease
MSKKIDSSASEVLKKPYARILIPEEDGTYSAQLLEFPGCYAEGDTAAEAIQDLENAAASWIEASREQGREIPEPLASYGYSGKINLRLPKSIHKQAARFAQKDDVSLNQFFASAIAARVGAEDLYERLAQRLEARLMPFVPIVTSQQIISVISFVPIAFSPNLGDVVPLSWPWATIPAVTQQPAIVPMTIATK